MAEKKLSLEYLKEAVMEPANFWGMAGFAVAAAYTWSPIPLAAALVAEGAYLATVPASSIYRRLVDGRNRKRLAELRNKQRERLIESFDPREREAVLYLKWLKKQIFDNYVMQMQRRSAEAMQLINQSKQAKLQEQLAQTMESFQLGDDASTFEEMREKIDRRAATAEAKLQLGATSVDTQMQEIEREAMDMQLHDKLAEYKRGMGLLGEGQKQAPALPAGGGESK